ncbi:MAG: bile acid:sodium symporter family protein [Planctomycetia bacterium]|nr:bile acid:sodium symporter family protein [Planctomycetia bacterium]
MNAFRNCLSKYLLIWLSIVCLFAFFWGDLFGAKTRDPFLIPTIAMQSLIAITMLAIGSLLPLDEVRNVGKRWPLVLWGTFIQYLSMPLLAWFVATLFHLEGPYFIGVILVGSVPGAMASNMLTMISRGNISFSVGLTTSATLLSPLIVPSVLLFLVGTKVSLDFGSIATTLLLTVVCPVVIGFTLSRIFKFWQWCANQIAEIIANIAIIWIIASVVAQNRTLFEHLPLFLFFALLLLNILGYSAGWFGGWTVGMDARMRRALLLEVGMQNAGLGTFLARRYFPDDPECALCCAMYTFGCMFTGIIVARIFRAIPLKEKDQSV